MSIDTILGIVGTVLGIIGLITGYYFYRKSIRNKEPYVSFKENNLIQGHISKFEGLEVLYKEQRVENLTVSKVIFWNNGTETIHRSDITNTDPIRVIGTKDGIKILDAKIIAPNNEANQFSCTLSDDMEAANITFDYLDRGQGAIIQTVHTGLKGDVGIAGTIKGVSDIRAKMIYFDDIDRNLPGQIILRRLSPNIRRVFVFLFWVLAGLLFSCMGIAFFLSRSAPEPPLQPPEPLPAVVGYFFAGTFVFAAIGMIWLAISVWLYRAPKGLDIFEE